MKDLPKYEIANLLSYTDLGSTLDLYKLSELLDSTEYEPEIYFALIYRLTSPKLSILINRSGKIIFTGAKSIDDIEIAHQIIIKKLSDIGYHPQKNERYIQNMVIKIKIPFDIKLFFNHGNIYKNQSIMKSRITIRSTNPRYTALVFKSGISLIMGIKSFDKINTCIQSLLDQLS